MKYYYYTLVLSSTFLLPVITHATTDTSDLGIVSSVSEGERIGAQVENLGDINADGYEDLGVGAPGYSGDRGAIYIIYGRANEYTQVDITNQPHLVGESENDRVGYSLAGAGDINADGYDDFMFGSIYEDSADKNAGATYIVYGRAEQFSGEVSIGSFTKYTGSNSADKFGAAMAGAGDINADGYDDIVMGAPRFGEHRTGEVYILYGGSEQLAGGEIADEGQHFSGEAEYDETGTSVSAAGDVNGDGFADIIIGSPGNDTTDDNAGTVYIIFGQVEHYDAQNITDADVILVGETARDSAGLLVAEAGDINADGYSDVLASSPYSSYNASEGGLVYVIYGSATLTNGSLADQVHIYGGNDNDFVGYSMAGNGDVDLDGYDDFIIGSPSGSGSANGIGVIVYGKAESLSSGSIRDHDVYLGEHPENEAGIDVAMLDIDGDSSSEIGIGAYRYSSEVDDSGRAYIGYIPVITCDNSAQLGGIMANYPLSEWKHRNYKKNEDLRIVVERKGTSAYLVNCKTDEVLQELQFNRRVQRKILARVFTKRQTPLFIAVTRTPDKRKIKIFLYKQKNTELELVDYIRRRWRPRGLRIDVNNYHNQVRLYKGKEKKHLIIYSVTPDLNLEEVSAD